MSAAETPGGRHPGPSEEDCLAYVNAALGSMPVKPRGYQAVAVYRVFDEFERGVPSTLLVMPTGLGKTYSFLLCAKHEIENQGGRVLILAHRGELINQAANAAGAVGLEPVIEKADQHARPDLTLDADAGQLAFASDGEADPRLVVASVQTLQGDRLKRWPPGHFSLIVCDEAHHAAADSYRRIIDHFRPGRYLGVTATYDRGDKTPIVGTGQPFETLAYEHYMPEAVHAGYLAPPRFCVVPCGVDLGSIRTTAGDLNAGDLEELLKPKIADLVNEMVPKLAGRKFLVFTPDVGSAELVASALCSVGVSAASVCGESKDRADILAEFRDGRHRGLVNCALLTEGYDNPAIDCVAIMRPTKSRALFTQMVGRGTRTHPGKGDCLVVLFDWEQGKHKLVRPVELFHTTRKGPVDAEVMDGAQALIDSGAEADLLAAMKRAAKEKRERDRLRIEVEARKARVRAYEYDPLGFDPAKGHHAPEFAGSWEAPATHNQVDYLLRKGFAHDFVGGLSKKRASGLIASLHERRQKGLATHKQVEALKRRGHPNAASYTFEQASAALDAIMRGRAG